MGHFGTSFDDNENSVIEVEILLEGNIDQIVASELRSPPKIKKSPKPAQVIEAKPDAPAKLEEETVSTTEVTSDSEDFLNSYADRPRQGRQLDASEKYIMALRKVLNQNKVYPSIAKRLKQKGRVVVRFVLRKDGQLLSAEVIKASQYAVLNTAAEELIKKIDKLKPFPDELQNQAVQSFEIPVDYDF